MRTYYNLTKQILLFFILLASSFSVGQTGCWKKVNAARGITGGGFIIGLTNTGKLYSWGSNNYGQLGIGNFINKNLPQLIGTTSDWKTFEIGASNVIALKNNGTLWTWGSGETIGNGTTVNQNSPIQIGNATDWKEISTGDFHIFAIKNNGTLWACGRNGYGQLGNNSTTISYSFVQIGNSNDWKEVRGGNVFSVGIKNNGTLWTWGSDGIGQLGNGTSLFSDVLIPTQIGTNTDWLTISVGHDHIIAIKTNGELWSWGSNSNGQLGINSTTSKSFPIKVGTDSDWVKISAGGNHNSAIKISGQIFVWGSNLYSALGVNYDENALQKILFPYPLQPTNDWNFIGNGSFNSVAIKQNGELYLWGRGQNGELGNSTNPYDQMIPLLLSCPITLGVSNYYSKNNKIEVSPNPTNRIVNISSPNETINQIKIYDMFGRLLKSQKGKNENEQINIQDLPNAIYLLEVKTDKGGKTVKIVKQ